MRRSASGLPPVWQVAQYWSEESAKETSRTVSPQTGQACPVRPSGSVLRVIQDRIEQKKFLQGHGFPVPLFSVVSDPAQLADAVKAFGYSVICKTATAGYDGKGQWRLASGAELEALLAPFEDPGVGSVGSVEELDPEARVLPSVEAVRRVTRTAARLSSTPRDPGRTRTTRGCSKRSRSCVTN